MPTKVRENCPLCHGEGSVGQAAEGTMAGCPDCSKIPRCMERNEETGQCELRREHKGKHLAGYLMW